MPLLSSQIARQENGRITLRDDPLQVTWHFDDLVAADGHLLQCDFSCSVRALPQPAEQKMLAEVFLTHSPVLTADHLVQHFHTALRNAATAVCRNAPAAQCIESDRTTILDALKAEANRLAFSSGLELLHPFNLQIRCPTLEQQRIERVNRALAEERAAGQIEHFQHAAELFKQFQTIQQSAPQLSPGQVLAQIGPADQAMLLQTLLLASAKEKTTHAAWAVAGMCLLRADPTNNPVTTSLTTLPDRVGPLRSVQPAHPKLLLGGRSGVMLLDPASPSDPLACLDPSSASPLGFSRALLWHDEIWACHSDAGIVAWNLAQPNQPLFTLRPQNLGLPSPRNLQFLDDSRLLFSSGPKLVALRRNPPGQDPPVFAQPIEPPAPADIVAILLHRDQLTLVLNDGRCQLRHPDSLQLLREQRPCATASAATLLPWLGHARILLSPNDGPLFCVSWDDDLVTQYQNPYRQCRELAAAHDLIVALSGDRQRVLLWQPWNGRQLLADLYVPSLTRHRAADVDLT